MSTQPFRSLTVAAQADLHCDNVVVSARRSHDSRGSTDLGWDNIWVDNLGPGDQGGMNGIEGRTFLELGGRDCGQWSIRDTPGATHPESDIPEAARAIEAKRKARMIVVAWGKEGKDWTVFVRDLGYGRPSKSPRFICESGSHLRVGLTRCQASH